MKITANFHKKVPVPGIEYGSQGYSCEIQIEPPPEIQQDREELKTYVERLFAECRARVEDQFGEASTRKPEPSESDHRSRHGHRPMRSRNGRENGNGSLASPKQLNYLRALANERRLGYAGLQELAEGEFGTDDILGLTRRQASELIDQLRPR